VASFQMIDLADTLFECDCEKFSLATPQYVQRPATAAWMDELADIPRSNASYSTLPNLVCGCPDSWERR
jgi:hypothetical protein